MRSETCLFSYRPERNSTWNSSRTRLNLVLRHSVQPPLALVGFFPGAGQAHQPQPFKWEHGGASWRQTGTPGGAPASPSSLPVWPDSKGFPGGSDGKESACRAGDPGSNPWLGRSLGEGMATLSSILAWKIQCTEEPGGLQSIGSQKVGHH